MTSRIAINEVVVPSYFAGQTVQDVDIEKNFGVALIAIKYQPTSSKSFTATKGSWQVTRFFTDFKFGEGDRIIVYGDTEQMKKMLEVFNK